MRSPYIDSACEEGHCAPLFFVPKPKKTGGETAASQVMTLLKITGYPKKLQNMENYDRIFLFLTGYSFCVAEWFPVW